MLSPKQIEILRWPYTGKRALICDGAVRSGKTSIMSLSFILWAMGNFDKCSFGLCGKTVASAERNVIQPLLSMTYFPQNGFSLSYTRSGHVLSVTRGTKRNLFYVFGGRDESSYMLIQGVTLAGVLLDEVALMPRSFVEQACARCSVKGAKLWFNCNPENPAHWFYREWVQRARERRALYLHFLMEDNPALSPEVIRRYGGMFSGNFYRRFVLGEWVAAEGRVYDFFDESYVKAPPEGELERWCISCDYGTVNPASFGLWGERDGVWYRVKEYYYDSREQMRQKTDGEYAQELRRLAGRRRIQTVVVDPSAASFLEVLRREGWRVVKAENDVLAGIRVTAELLRQGRLVICSPCVDAIREFSLYSWDETAIGDRVRKVHDHAMDDIRYFAVTVAARRGGGYVGAACVERRRF